MTNGLSFAWMTQLLPTFGAQIADRAGFAEAIGLDAGRPRGAADRGSVVRRRLPVRAGEDHGRRSTASRSTGAALARVYEQAKCDDLAVFFFTTDRTGASGDETVYSRMLAPQFGVVEDPATGGASGPLGSYLLHHGVVSAAQARSMVSLQGVAMKRPSRIHISIDSDGGTITRVRVGGQSVLVAEGTLLV